MQCSCNHVQQTGNWVCSTQDTKCDRQAAKCMILLTSRKFPYTCCGNVHSDGTVFDRQRSVYGNFWLSKISIHTSAEMHIVMIQCLLDKEVCTDIFGNQKFPYTWCWKVHIKYTTLAGQGSVYGNFRKSKISIHWKWECTWVGKKAAWTGAWRWDQRQVVTNRYHLSTYYWCIPHTTFKDLNDYLYI